MNATWFQMALVLLPVVVGAMISVAPTILIERSRVRTTLRTRWDADLEEICADFAATARRILDLAERSPDAAAEDYTESIRGEHGRLQRLMAEIRLLAGGPVQSAARRVVRHSWALQMSATMGVDPREIDYPGESPRERTLSSLFDFYRTVRRQLRVPDAADLVAVNPLISDRAVHPTVDAGGGRADDHRLSNVH
jgi:hypothetical protein